jgi:multidrug efflux pump subunit AcrA (membrane-fusion protein)
MEVMTVKKTIFTGMVLLALLLSGCTGDAEETPTPEAETDFTPVVSVTGEVVPAEWATVSAQVGGMVDEVLVEPGDEVAQGDPLVRLGDIDAQLALQEAEAALEAAQAQLALLEAGPRSEEVAVAEQQVEAARAALSQAAADRDRLKAGAMDAEVEAAEADVAQAYANRMAALEAHDQSMKCFDYKLPTGEKMTVCPGLGAVEEQTRYALHAADEALAAAQTQLDALEAGGDSRIRAIDAAVWAAAVQRDIAQAQLDLLRAGATAEEIAVAEASLSQAEVALETARVALKRCEVHAPFTGTVGVVSVRMGESIAPGQPVVTLGDLSTLRVETTDLSEIDVARVAIGQEVGVTFDALPEQVFTGRVTRISPMAEPGTGGVNYTVVIELEEIAPQIRWGMTAFVDIEVGK